jgi:heme-degrading monooxygenase HmoA
MTDSELGSNSSSESIMADLWSVQDGNQDAFLERVKELFERLRRSPGFIEGQILSSVNPTKFLAYSRFESTVATEDVQEDPAIAAAIRALRSIAHQDMSRYTLVESFLPPN